MVPHIRFHAGETVGIAGQLVIGEEVQTDWALTCQLRTACGTIIRRIPMVFDSEESTYACSIDTSDLKGTVKLRFVAEVTSGAYVVNDEDLTLKFYE